MQLSSRILLGMVLGIILGLILNSLGGADPDKTPIISWFVNNVFDWLAHCADKNIPTKNIYLIEIRFPIQAFP